MKERGEIREGEGTTTQSNINSQGGVAGATRDGHNGLISSTLVNICVIIGFAAFAYTVKCVLKAVDNSQDIKNLGLNESFIHRIRMKNASLGSCHFQGIFSLFSGGNKIYFECICLRTSKASVCYTNVFVVAVVVFKGGLFVCTVVHL